MDPKSSRQQEMEQKKQVGRLLALYLHKIRGIFGDFKRILM